MTRVVVLASGRGSNFQALLNAVGRGSCSAELVALVTDNPTSGALALAQTHALRFSVVPRSRSQTRQDWNAALLDAVATHEPDLVVLAGFMRIVDRAFVDAFAQRIINVHPSLLPSFPGLDAPAQAIDAGVRISGCTVHLVDTGVDTGTILAQAAVPVMPDDDAESLHQRIRHHEHRLLPAVVHAVSTGHLSLGDPLRDQDPHWVRFQAHGALESPEAQ